MPKGAAEVLLAAMTETGAEIGRVWLRDRPGKPDVLIVVATGESAIDADAAMFGLADSSHEEERQ